MQPHSLERLPEATPDEIAACRALLRDGSRTFYAASFLLPRGVREPASCLYAFCRLADDAIDIGGTKSGGIAALRRRLDDAYRGRPASTAIDRAFAATIERHGIPREIPDALTEGLAWDAGGRTYETLDDLTAYATRVAGAVGVMMGLVMGVRDPQLLARACDLGIAMQFTNIARDVGEDARAGRIYLPLSWMREASIDPKRWLADPQFTPALGDVVERLLAVASKLYERADAGIAGLPASCRPGIRAARLLYSEIGNEVGRNGLNSVARRAVVPARVKLQGLCRAVSVPPANPGHLAEPCVPQANYLVEAVARNEWNVPTRTGPDWWDLHGQAVRVLEIFEQLERRQRGTRPASGARRVVA